MSRSASRSPGGENAGGPDLLGCRGIRPYSRGDPRRINPENPIFGEMAPKSFPNPYDAGGYGDRPPAGGGCQAQVGARVPPQGQQETSEMAGIYLGIDPGGGKTAGMAYTDGSQAGTKAVVMPSQPVDVWNWITYRYNLLRLRAGAGCAVLEKVTGWIPPRRGTEADRAEEIRSNTAPGSSMFNFGVSYGLVKGFLIAAEIPFVEVIPRVWQRAMGVETRGRDEVKSHYKGRLKLLAMQLFPRHKVVLGTSDALIIAEYCRRRDGGIL